MEMRVLQLSWPLPQQKQFYRTKPIRYVSHLIGHESAGSILALLKKKGWADSLSAGEGSAASDFSSFIVNIELTEDGMQVGVAGASRKLELALFMGQKSRQ